VRGVIPLAFWEGVAVGLGFSAVGMAVLWWFLRRRVRRLMEPALPGPGSIPVAVPNGLPHPAESTFTGPPFRGSLDARAATEPRDVDVGAPEGVRPPSVPTLDADLRLSQRVLLHVARQGIVGPNDVAPRALSQGGMVEALAVPQGVLTGVLRRLVAAGVISEHREHARGVDRRVKVYRLTSLGEQVARELRTRPKP